MSICSKQLKNLVFTRNLISNHRYASNKVFASAAEAVKDVKDGSTILAGGFGICGNAESLCIGK